MWLRLGDDQVVALVPERGELKPGERVHARVDHPARHATECNHTATHLLHAALRRHPRHARPSSGLLRRTGQAQIQLHHRRRTAPQSDELAEVEDQVNVWILGSHPVRALTTTLPEAKRLGAMALFGEKYGDVVRMVEVGDGSFSRELCGGTHVHITSEIALFKVLTGETSSAANVRRIEAVDRARLGGAGCARVTARSPLPRRRCGCRRNNSPDEVAQLSRPASASSSARSDVAVLRGNNGPVDVEAADQRRGGGDRRCPRPCRGSAEHRR